MTSDAREQAIEQAAEVIWERSRTDEGTISAIGANNVARALADAGLLRTQAAPVDEHDPRCISLTESEYSGFCDCETFRMIDAHEAAPVDDEQLVDEGSSADTDVCRCSDENFKTAEYQAGYADADAEHRAEVEKLRTERNEFRTEVIRQGTQVVAANVRADRAEAERDRLRDEVARLKAYLAGAETQRDINRESYDVLRENARAWALVNETRAERDQLRRQVQAVRALHFTVEEIFLGDPIKYCDACPEEDFPCPTIRALDGAEGGASNA